uniref:ribonuclease H n=1 Tax=Sinocyclocheilus rhinocerous TaxID=307959 RepID=A0A673IM55_9TELE
MMAGKNQPLYMAFLDLEKAFNRVPRDLIWHSLCSRGAPEEYIWWIQLLYANTTSVFPITVGVHQGSALFPLLFILCMNTPTADIQVPQPWSLLFADDIFQADETRSGLECQVRDWNEWLDMHGLCLNIKKTEYMECIPRHTMLALFTSCSWMTLGVWILH